MPRRESSKRHGHVVPVPQAGFGAREHRRQPRGPEPQHRLGADVRAGGAHRPRHVRHLLGIADPHRRRPVRVRHPSGRLRDHRGDRDVDRDGVRLRMVEAARRVPLRAHARAAHAAVPARRGVGGGQDLLRPRAAQPAAGRDGEVHHAADARVVPRRGAQRGGVVREVPRRTDDRRRAGGARHHPARPRLGVGDHLDRDGRAARRRRQGALHRVDHVPVDRHRAGGVRRTLGERLPGRPHPCPVQPRRSGRRRHVPGGERHAGDRHGRHLGEGLAAGAPDERSRHPRHVGRLPLRRGRRAVRSRRVCGGARPDRRGARADLADRPPVTRSAGHLSLRRCVHDGALADVPERRDDAADHACHRDCRCRSSRTAARASSCTSRCSGSCRACTCAGCADPWPAR